MSKSVKIILSIAVLLFVVVVGVVVYKQNNVEAKVEKFDSKVAGCDTLKDIEDGSELIVKVTKVASRPSKLKKDEDGLVYSFSTLTEVKIDKVWKGDKKAGDKLLVSEGYCVDKASKTLYLTNQYNAMENGKEYLLFLGKGHERKTGEITRSPRGMVYGLVDIKAVQSGEYTISKVYSDYAKKIETECGPDYEDIQNLHKEMVAKYIENNSNNE